MNPSTAPESTSSKTDRFERLPDLRASHGELLRLQRAGNLTPEFWKDALDFIRKGQALGALLESDRDRQDAQNLLDYWSTLLYREGVDTSDATLGDFDPEQAPLLDDASCPYMGLEAFHDARYFFGRQKLLQALLSRADQDRLLSVVGSSGSGKSSLVRGGLLPAIRARHPGWRIYPPMVPGADPLTALAKLLQPTGVEASYWIPRQVAAFRADPGHLVRLVAQLGTEPAVLVIDQFEEIFSLGSDVDRKAFVANLTKLMGDDLGSNDMVILTMRVDFESQVARLEEFQPLYERSKISVPPLSPSELREAISEPAKLVGLVFEEGIVEEFVEEILGEPAALPLLQFTLLKLWEKRVRNRVTREAYLALGGPREALNNSAEDHYKMIPENQEALKRILLAMVQPGVGLEVTSRRIRRSELPVEAGDRVRRVLDGLCEARLVRLSRGETEEEDQIEVAHEALIRNWRRLIDWLDEKRRADQQRVLLTSTAKDWANRGRDQEALWRGAQLEEARTYRNCSPEEEEFLRASQEAVDRAEREKDAALKRQVEDERRASFRLKVALSGLIVLSALALWAASRANMEAKKARLAKEEADVRKNAAQALSSLARDRLASSLELSLTAHNKFQHMKITDDLDVRDSLRTGLEYSPHLHTFLSAPKNDPSSVPSVAFSPNGKRWVAAAWGTTIQLWEVVDGQERESRTMGAAGKVLHAGKIHCVAFSPDGTKLASGSADKQILVWDVATGAVIGGPLLGHKDGVRSLAFSPDGSRLASGGRDRDLLLWDITRPSPVRRFHRDRKKTTHDDTVSSVAFSSDGQTLASGSADKTILLWNVTTGEALTDPLNGHYDYVTSIAFNDRGKLASGSGDGRILVWDVSRIHKGGEITHHDLNTWQVAPNYILSVAFSPDNTSLAAGISDHTIRVWDIVTREPIGEPFRGNTDHVLSVAFSADGRFLVSGSNNGRVIIWDVTHRRQLDAPHERQAEITSLAFSPDGKTLASGSGDKTIALWDFRHREPVLLNGHTNWVSSVAFSPDGSLLASGSWDQSIILWEVAWDETKQRLLGRIKRKILGNSGSVNAVAFSSEGKVLASGHSDGSVLVWDPADDQSIGKRLGTHDSNVFALAFSPGKSGAGRSVLASGSWDNTVKLWDVATPGEPRTLKAPEGDVYSLAFSPDGQTLASGSQDGTIILWDVAKGTRRQQFPTHKDRENDEQNNVRSLAFSPDGQTLASGSWNKTLKLWNINGEFKNVFRTELPGYLMSVAFSPDGQRIATGGQYKTIYYWDLSSPPKPEQPPVPGPFNQVTIQDLAFSPDSKSIATSSFDNSIIISDVASRKPIGEPLRGHGDLVRSVKYSHDGRLVASGSWDRTVRLWDSATGQPSGRPLLGHTHHVFSVAFSPNSKTLASGDWSGKIKLWDVASRQEIGEMSRPRSDEGGGSERNLLCLAYSHRGDLLASGMTGGTVYLWDTGKREFLRPAGRASGDDYRRGALWDVAAEERIDNQLDGGPDWMRCLAFGHNDKVLAVGGGDGLIHLWELDKPGQPMSSLVGHRYRINGLAFSSDGHYLLSGDSKGTVLLWDAHDRKPVGIPLEEPGRRVNVVSISPDDQLLAAGCEDGRVLFWDLGIKKWAEQARRVLGRFRVLPDPSKPSR